MDSNWRWYVFKSVAGIVAAVGTLSFFWEPLNSIAAWFRTTLTASPIITRFPTIAVIGWGILTVLSLVILAQIYRTRNRPVTILTSIFIDRFCDSEGRRVYCRRRQIFRANRPGVTSYPIGTTPNYGGSTSRDSLKIHEDGKRCDSEDLITGAPKSGWHIVHRFTEGLNFSVIFAMLPSWVICKTCIEIRSDMPTVIRGQRFLRTLDVEYELCDEYNDIELPTSQLRNPNRIRQRDIWFVVEFADYPVESDSVVGHVITDRHVMDLDRKSVDHQAGRFVFHVPVLMQNTIRISWARTG